MDDAAMWRFEPGAGYIEGTDLAGYKIAAGDGELGSVERFDDRPGQAALVIDTGPWFLGRKVVLPAGAIKHINHQSRTIDVGCTKEHIRNAPPYDPDHADADRQRERLASYYAGVSGES